AGTHTPLLLLYLDNGWGIFYLVVLWVMVLCGTLYKIFLFGKYPLASLIFYLVMGWMAVFSLPAMFEAMSAGTFGWLLAGGLSYTVGTIFYAWEKINYSHAIWHLFVIGGTSAHYVSVLLAVQAAT
ncbi:MAG: hemolysin III family protein, partial [Bacteroidota bacterium]